MILLHPFPLPDDISPRMLVNALQPHVVDGCDIMGCSYDEDDDNGLTCLNGFCESINDTYRKDYRYINIIGYTLPNKKERYTMIGLKVHYGN